MALFFKAVPPAQDKDPGEEYKKVLAFKQQIFDGKKHLCGSFKKPRDFGEHIEAHLAQWLADHIRTPGEDSLPEPQSRTTQSTTVSPPPTFAYWRAEAWKVMEAPNNDYAAGLIFANRAVDAATDANELSRALNTRGYAHAKRREYSESLASFQEQIEALAGISTADKDERIAMALFNKGGALSGLDRHAEAIATFDELIKRYSNSDAEPLREKVAEALIWKARNLSQMKQVTSCIAALDAWAEKRGGFNCDEVAAGIFFKPIRDDPEFAAYLASKGCVAG